MSSFIREVRNPPGLGGLFVRTFVELSLHFQFVVRLPRRSEVGMVESVLGGRGCALSCKERPGEPEVLARTESDIAKMQRKDIEEQLDLLKTAINEKQPSDNVISILTKLKAEVVPTEDILRSTKAGMIVAKQRANPDKAVARLASEIVSKWKTMVEAEKRRKAGGAGAKTGTASPSKNVDASSPAPAPPATESDEWKGGDPAKRKWQEDGVDIKRTGVPTRDNCVGLLYNGLAFMSKASSTKVILKGMEVEKAAYTKYKGDTPEYRAKMRSLFQNLKNKQNKDLGPRVLNGEISADRFVVMTHDELKSAERKKEDDELQKDNMKRAQVPMAERSISDALKCGRCGQKKVSYSQAQTRSADEPMTTFCECTVCGNRWKFS
ncbi:hypothetical protein V498_07129 [Pseudogymnoascus sp. VKM F-4517 (FW-2822)]|nr:hypothetical protein V498_07129 [Pseudogymnoascus sp. VKM F-4517 (FW-2822)]